MPLLSISAHRTYAPTAIAVVLLLLAQCNPQETSCHHSAWPQGYLLYQAAAPTQPTCGHLAIDQAEQRLYFMTNQTALPENLSLLTANGGATPVYQADTLRLADQEWFRYQFRPVNNMELYRKTGFEGDFAPAYTVVRSNAATSDSTVFSLSKEQHRAYVLGFGTEQHLQFYRWANTHAFVSAEATHLDTMLPLSALPEARNYHNRDKHSVQLQDHELIIDGVMLQIKAFSDQHFYFLDLKIVHHGVYPLLKVYPEDIRLRLKESGAFLTPLNLQEVFEQGEKEAETGALLLPKGNRLRYLFRYKKSESAHPKSLLANFGGLLAGNIPLILPLIEFEAETVAVP